VIDESNKPDEPDREPSSDAAEDARNVRAAQVAVDDPGESGADQQGDAAEEQNSFDLIAPPPSYDQSAGGPSDEYRDEEAFSGDASAKPVEEVAEDEEPDPAGLPRQWYILKVQSNRENSIADALRRRVNVAGMEDYFGEIIVPMEKVTEFKGGKKKIVKRKLYPGYIVVNMAITEETWFLVRDTPGIGDFTGAAGHPSPMLEHEVERITQAAGEEKQDEAPKLKIAFNVGNRVKINEGTFENFEGEVSGIDETKGTVTVMINIFGRSTPVELEYWQIEAL